jgi:RNA polymerase sigma factor (sigma-70 family)
MPDVPTHEGLFALALTFTETQRFCRLQIFLPGSEDFSYSDSKAPSFFMSHRGFPFRLKGKRDPMAEETYTSQTNLEQLVALAKEGRKNALEELVRRIQDRIYGLALRSLFLPADAEDATQEILIRIITHLDSYKGESRFTTWCFRVAANHLLSTRKRRAERWFSFEKCARAIEEALSMSGAETSATPEENLIAEEVRLACLQGMLLCLSRKIRLVFILGVVFGVTSDEGAHILDITREAFRKRLSRGREQVQNFMSKKCSLMNPENPCVCTKMVPYEIKIGLLDPQNLRFANHRCYARGSGSIHSRLEELDELKRLAVLFRSHPDYAAPETFAQSIKKLVESKRLEILSERRFEKSIQDMI